MKEIRISEEDARDIIESMIKGVELAGKYYINSESVIVDALKVAKTVLDERVGIR